MKRRLTAAAALLCACALAAPAARAQAPDSSLHRFLERMADSTDVYFGLAAAPTDTTGLDSALAAGLERPWKGPRTARRASLAPRYAFNRVDGSVWGAGWSLADRAGRLRIAGDAGYAQGARGWLGGGELALGARAVGRYARVRLRGGRRTAGMDRDHDERTFATLKALVSGDDRQHYLRRDGWSLETAAWRPAWHAALALRDRVEGPLAVTTTWDLFGEPLAQPGNVAAAAGRSREIGVTAGVRWPLLPLSSAVTHDLASRALGGDFEFRRTRVTLGGEFPVTRAASLLPQLAYGRLTGDAVPQAAFYLGGPRSLRSLPPAALGGTGTALARLDLVGAFDVLEQAGVPHPAWLPLQIGAFAAAGALWGADPFGGSGSPGGHWPQRGAWRAEAGAGVLYRPGVPDEDGYLRLEHAWPLGPDGRRPRWSVGYARALELVPRF